MGNIQGLYPKTNQSKVAFLKELAAEEDPMYIALTESHLKKEVMDAEIEIDKYTPYRADRKTRSHGGVVTYVRSDLTPDIKLLLSYSNSKVEILALHIKPVNTIVINCYRPPQCDLESFANAVGKLNNIFENLPTPMPDINLTGDFNFPIIQWPEGTISGGTREDQLQANLLLDTADKVFLTQLITRPTRLNNTLDLFFTNNEEAISSYRVEKTIFTDHNLISVNTTLRKVKTTEKETAPPNTTPFDTYNFQSDQINWEEVDDSFRGVNWQQVMEANDPEEMLQALSSKLLEVCNKHIPLRRKKNARRSAIPRDRKILMKKRASLNKQLTKATTEERKRSIEARVAVVETLIKESHESQRKKEESQAISNIKRNPKYFFSYCKKFSKTKTKVGPLKTEDGTTTRDPKETCRLLMHQYNSVFNNPKAQAVVENPEAFFAVDRQDNPTINTQLSDMQFTTEDIRKAIAELRPNAAAGPDGIPAILLLKCKETLAHPITMLWRCSLDSGTVPQLLKQATISPIHKGGDKSLPQNYRPVALTSHIIKVFEKCVRNHITTYMEENNLLNTSQHGFRKGRSCLSNLLTHYDQLLHNLAEGKNTDVVFLDFAKAFDKVDHGVLLHKLKSLGITGKLGLWLHSFLVGRSQSVAVDGEKSIGAIVLSGVPQGSVLGPLLFIIHLGDIDGNVGSSVLASFADDTNISKAITNEEDVHHLQEDLNKVFSWATENNMQFNGEKFELLRYGPNTNLKGTTSLHTENGQVINPEPHVKCLGVHLSDDACFHYHITEAVNKAKRMAGWVLRTFASREREVMLTLWKALVQPALDYCSQLWSPHKKGEIQKLESVQRSFTKQIQGMRDLNYWERLKALGLYSQQRRRERYRAIYIWKVLEHLVPDPTTSALYAVTKQRTGRKCVRRALTSRAPQRIKSLLAASLGHEGPRLFNSLPASVRDLTGCPVDRFKSGLDRFLSTLPDEPPVPGYTPICRAASNSIPDHVALQYRDTRAGVSGGPPRL